MVHISEVYADALSTNGKGYALWHPEPDIRGEVRIGDVGFLEEGKFIKLFNVTDDLAASDMPENFTPLKFDHRILDKRPKLIQGPISSQGATATEISVGAAVRPGVTSVGAGYEFEVSQSRGALLIPHSPADQEILLTNATVPRYIKRHYGSWKKASCNIGFPNNTDLIFVRGWIKTDRWTVAAYHASSASRKGHLKARFEPIGEAGFALKTSSEYRSSVESHSGPLSDSESPQCPSHLTHCGGIETSRNTMAQSPPRRLNQCVFLPHYKVRRALGMPLWVSARAGPHELPEDPDDGNDGDAALVVGTEDAENAPAESQLDVVLDYLLRQPNVEVAIACEDDISGLFIEAPWPTDLREWLDRHEPRVDVEDGLGQLSLEDAIDKRRRYEITKSGREWQESRMGVDSGGLSCQQDGNVEGNPLIGEGTVVLGKRPPGSPGLKWAHLNLHDTGVEGVSVTSVSLAADGTHIVTGSDDGCVRLWDIKTGQMKRRWKRHGDTVWSVAYSHDGSQLVSASADKKVIVWNMDADQNGLVQELEGHTAEVWTAVYSPSGRMVASGSGDSTVKIWDATSYGTLHTLQVAHHSADVHNVGWTPDEQRVVSCAGFLGRIWSVDTGELLHTLEGHNALIWSMSISQAGDRVITGSEDNTSRIWSTETGEELVTIQEHSGLIWAVTFSPDGTEVASCSNDCTIVTSDSYSGALRHIIKVDDRPSVIHSVAYSVDGEHLFSGSVDGNVRMWDRERGEMIAEMQGHKDGVKHLLFSNDNKELYSASEDGCVKVWSLQDLARVL